MAKYRKRDFALFTAEQFLPKEQGWTGWPEAVYGSEEDVAYIETPEGPLPVSDGDWIITDPEGTTFSCKPDIFEATYKLLEEW